MEAWNPAHTVLEARAAGQSPVPTSRGVGYDYTLRTGRNDGTLGPPSNTVPYTFFKTPTLYGYANHGSAYLSWEWDEEAAFYRIYRDGVQVPVVIGTSTGDPEVTVQDVPQPARYTTSAIAHGMSQGVEYDFTLTTVYASGYESPHSNVRTLTTCKQKRRRKVTWI
jgi:hypothetical protein